ncbi:MAG: serine--tRNA ligase [Candidatus Omnitrophica bacterium]|nr:serine--tRNA ligase [Candidatus Omnitrophota bacterium]
MLDLKFLRENLPAVKQALHHRNSKLDLSGFAALDAERRKLLTEAEELKHQKNTASEEIARLLGQKQDASKRIAEMKTLSQKIKSFDAKVGEIDVKMARILEQIPNLAHSSVPVGSNTANKIVKEWGKRPQIVFQPKTHLELGEALDILDFPRAAKMTGSNFPLYKGGAARLERALWSWMLDVHTQEHGYREIFPPFLVNRASMFGTGQLPRFEEDMYRLKDDDLFLVPTAEVPVTNLHRDEVLDEAQLPIKYTAYTACFRREAGSYGKETKGLIRVHQFDKVELVKFTTPETSYQEHESLLQNAETILQRLGLQYRVVLLATGDLGFAAAKCYDLEAYAPGLDMWLEVSSCSNFEAFQARRANIRYRPKGSTKTAYVHTLNGSGVALARTMVCLLETYQEADGRIRMPDVLQPYLHGQTHLDG